MDASEAKAALCGNARLRQRKFYRRGERSGGNACPFVERLFSLRQQFSLQKQRKGRRN
ncbi:hypothetical protein [Oxalicibacterium solurbis]|uniref:hypothetical protein n=1 Tax=Oxalicibacterium solurbis TaxID=69280 RepID=UPI001662CF63|nr:hypothetical protein [Oxalicibacterium solurbis]